MNQFKVDSRKYIDSLSTRFMLVMLAFNFMSGCRTGHQNQALTVSIMKEHQITFSPKNHSLDNNDNFSPDGKYLCYDTRGTVINDDIANSKTIEKVEIATGIETVLWHPLAKSGKQDQAAPGVGAVSWHPSENKVIFIHGPFIEEVEKRGFYGKKNRTAIVVGTEDDGQMTRIDMRDVATDRPTTPGAHRGGTHRHEYSRNGQRIGFTYDDFLFQQYDRTIGYMEKSDKSPDGYTHFFALLVKPAEMGKSKPGEIEKAWDDSWIDFKGKQRAFIAKIRAENGVDYENDLCVAEIPDKVEISQARAGSVTEYPEPPPGIRTHRLTHNGSVSGIVRGSPDGGRIAFFAKDKHGIMQIFVIATDGSDLAGSESKRPYQVTSLAQHAFAMRWHPSGNWLLFISAGNIYAADVGESEKFGKAFQLTSDQLYRSQLAVSPDGTQAAYNIRIPTKDETGKKVTDAQGRNFAQIFVMELEMEKLN